MKRTAFMNQTVQFEIGQQFVSEIGTNTFYKSIVFVSVCH